MKLKSLVIILFTTLICSIHICAQPQSAKQSYNFTRALEEAQKGNKSEAMDFLTKEIAENPGNGYAHMTIAILQADAENYGDAMKSVNMAIKKLPKKDKEYMARAFASRAHLYTIAGDTIQSLNDFNQAIKINPYDSDILETYGQLLYEMERYSDANDIYNRMVAANPTSVMGYMGLGRNAYA
ncbi:MAG: aspartic protease, partial [Lachnospiraceae bacterium]|nr:aspartic protease [Lachnospiraceae bacterium]